MQSIYLAGGCFWCTEAIFNQIKGIIKIIPGYIGGKTPNPTYNMICTGNTGHAEAVECSFDEKIISLNDILEIFFSTHDSRKAVQTLTGVIYARDYVGPHSCGKSFQNSMRTCLFVNQA